MSGVRTVVATMVQGQNKWKGTENVPFTDFSDLLGVERVQPSDIPALDLTGIANEKDPPREEDLGSLKSFGYDFMGGVGRTVSGWGDAMAFTRTGGNLDPVENLDLEDPLFDGTGKVAPVTAPGTFETWLQEKGTALQDRFNYIPKETRGFFGDVFHGAVSSSPFSFQNLIAQMGVNALVGPFRPLQLAMSAFFAHNESTVESMDVYRRLVDQGVAPKQAYGRAKQVYNKNLPFLMADNLAEALMYIPGANSLFNKEIIRTAVKKLDKPSLKLLFEAGQEGFEEFFQGRVSAKALGEPVDPYEELVGVATGATMGAAGGGVGQFYRRQTTRHAMKKLTGKIVDEVEHSASNGFSSAKEKRAFSDRVFSVLVESLESNLPATPVGGSADIAISKSATPNVVTESSTGRAEAGSTNAIPSVTAGDTSPMAAVSPVVKEGASSTSFISKRQEPLTSEALLRMSPDDASPLLSSLIGVDMGRMAGVPKRNQKSMLDGFVRYLNGGKFQMMDELRQKKDLSLWHNDPTDTRGQEVRGVVSDWVRRSAVDFFAPKLEANGIASDFVFAPTENSVAPFVEMVMNDFSEYMKAHEEMHKDMPMAEKNYDIIDSRMETPEQRLETDRREARRRDSLAEKYMTNELRPPDNFVKDPYDSLLKMVEVTNYSLMETLRRHGRAHDEALQARIETLHSLIESLPIEVKRDLSASLPLDGERSSSIFGQMMDDLFTEVRDRVLASRTSLSNVIEWVNESKAKDLFNTYGYESLEDLFNVKLREKENVHHPMIGRDMADAVSAATKAMSEKYGFELHPGFAALMLDYISERSKRLQRTMSYGNNPYALYVNKIASVSEKRDKTVGDALAFARKVGATYDVTTNAFTFQDSDSQADVKRIEETAGHMVASINTYNELIGALSDQAHDAARQGELRSLLEVEIDRAEEIVTKAIQNKVTPYDEVLRQVDKAKEHLGENVATFAMATRDLVKDIYGLNVLYAQTGTYSKDILAAFRDAHAKTLASTDPIDIGRNTNAFIKMARQMHTAISKELGTSLSDETRALLAERGGVISQVEGAVKTMGRELKRSAERVRQLDELQKKIKPTRAFMTYDLFDERVARATKRNGYDTESMAVITQVAAVIKENITPQGVDVNELAAMVRPVKDIATARTGTLEEAMSIIEQKMKHAQESGNDAAYRKAEVEYDEASHLVMASTMALDFIDEVLPELKGETTLSEFYPHTQKTLDELFDEYSATVDDLWARTLSLDLDSAERVRDARNVSLDVIEDRHIEEGTRLPKELGVDGETELSYLDGMTREDISAYALGILPHMSVRGLLVPSDVQRITSGVRSWRDGCSVLAETTIDALGNKMKSGDLSPDYLDKILTAKLEGAPKIFMELLDGLDSETGRLVIQLGNVLDEVNAIRVENKLPGIVVAEELSNRKTSRAEIDPTWQVSHQDFINFFAELYERGLVTRDRDGASKTADLAAKYIDAFNKGNRNLPDYVMPLLGGTSSTPYTSLYTTMKKYISMTSRDVMLKQIAERTGVIVDSERRGYVQLVSENNAYGEYEGKWVPRSLADDMDLHEETRVYGATYQLFQSYRAIHSLFKTSKILLSSTSYVNNFFGNFFLSQLRGVPLWWQVAHYHEAAAEVVSWVKTGIASPNLMEAIRHGVFTGTMAKSELLLLAGSLEAVATARNLTGAAKAIFKGVQTVQEKAMPLGTIYEAIEQIHRYLDYRFFTERGTFEFGWDAESGSLFDTKIMTPREAVRAVNGTLFDYTRLPKPIRMLRDSIFPFISFPYFASVSLATNAVLRPWNVVRVAITGAMIRALFRQMTGGDDGKELYLNNKLPFWDLFDLAFGYVEDKARDIFSVDNSVPRLFYGRQGQVDPHDRFRDVAPGGPAWSLVESVRGVQSFGGFRIWEESDPLSVRLGKSLFHMVRTMSPAAAVNWWYNLSMQMEGKRSWDKTLARMVGIRYDDINNERYRRERYWLDKAMRERLYKYRVFYENHHDDLGAMTKYLDRMYQSFERMFLSRWMDKREKQLEWYHPDQ